MTLPALGAQGGVAGQCRHVRARVGGRPPTPTGYAGSHSTPTCPRRRTAGAAPPTRPCAKGAQPGSPRSQPRLPSLCNDPGPGRCWRQSSVCLRYRWGAGTGCPILGHTEGEPGVSTGRAPPHEPRRWGVSTGHRAGDKGGGVTGSPGPSRGQVAVCSGWQRAQHEGDQRGSCHGLETHRGTPAPRAVRGHAAAGTGSLGPARSRAALGQLSGRPTSCASTLTWPQCHCVTSPLSCPAAPQESNGESPRTGSAGQRSWAPGLTPAGVARAKASATATRLHCEPAKHRRGRDGARPAQNTDVAQTSKGLLHEEVALAVRGGARTRGPGPPPGWRRFCRSCRCPLPSAPVTVMSLWLPGD